MTLTGGTEVRARAVVVATGVSYNRLAADGADDLLGKGVFYGAATAEAQALSGQDVFIVGGGNSAGQAAVHLAKYAATVTMIVRDVIGAGPHTGWLAGALQRDERGYIRTGRTVVRGSGVGETGWPLDRAPYPLETSLPGVFAAGDVRDRSVKRVASAVGDGAIAISSVHDYLADG